MKEFNAEKATKDVIQWIKDWFEQNGPNSKAFIGMSGGKDSTIIAKLLIEALGSGRVHGLVMPSSRNNMNAADIICRNLHIRYNVIHIKHIFNRYQNAVYTGGNARGNLLARIRMSLLYAYSQMSDGRVVNTCNLSEDYLGYFTIFGDGAGDFAPLKNFTVTEILQIGDYLGLPKEWVHKTPDDGLPDSSPDEEKFGFSYADLDKYIRTGEGDPILIDKIEKMHRANLFKLQPMANFNVDLNKYYEN